jgi:hypothetical protein
MIFFNQRFFKVRLEGEDGINSQLISIITNKSYLNKFIKC